MPATAFAAPLTLHTTTPNTEVLALAFRSVGASTSPVAAPFASLTLLDKRQQGSSSPSGATLEEAARNYEELLVQGAQAVSSSDGECRQPCLPFVMGTTVRMPCIAHSQHDFDNTDMLLWDCANQGGTLQEIGLCSCEASQAARVCGNCEPQSDLPAADSGIIDVKALQAWGKSSSPPRPVRVHASLRSTM